MAARARAEAGRELRGADGELLGADGAAGPDRADRGRAGRVRPGRVRAERVRPGRGWLGGIRISPAVRRLVVTPTFAAGLGVVVAAFLAANRARTVLHFSAPIPGNQCSAGDCHAQEPHSGTLASARPGVRIRPSAPSAASPGAGLQPGGTAPAAGGSGAPQPSLGAPSLSIRYQQVEQWPGGFADQITISGLSRLSGTGTRAWRLAFAYPGARIAGVQGARWEPGGAGAGVARGVSWPGWGQAQSSTVPVRLMVIVQGPPAPPSGCAFDGEPCTFASP